jgi:phage gp16-like protein
MTGASANQVTSATILNIAKIRIKNNTTVLVSDLPSRHKLHDQIRNKRNIRNMKRVRTKGVLPSNRKRGFIGSINSTMLVRRAQRRNLSIMRSHMEGNTRI